MKRSITLTILSIFLAVAAYAGSAVEVSKGAVATASPAATQVGVFVLSQGGNAMDTAVAVSMALAVAYPQAGNIGGGGFLMYYDAKAGQVWSLDFREVGPLEAKRDMYLDKDGKAKPKASMIGMLAAGVPGTVSGLEEAHRKFGKLPWKELLQPAVKLARGGFPVPAGLTSELKYAQEHDQIDTFKTTAAVFYPGGNPVAAGTILKQPDLAATLERIAEKGAYEFYEGATAKKLVKSVRAGGGIINYRDLRSYKPVWRAPIRVDFLGYELYTMAPPSGGGLVIGEVLKILAPYDLASYGFQTPRSIHLVAEAERRAYTDRNKYLGDPSSAHIPLRDLLSDERAQQWRASIDLDKATASAELKEPGAFESTETTHFSIIDTEGNIAAITTTLNGSFGNGVVVSGAGFLMNNEMDDFTTAPGQPNLYGLVQSDANAVAPGKRMASSMSPTIVIKDGKPVLVIGSPGGSTIPTSVLQVFLNVAVYGKSLEEAVAAPRYHHQGVPEDIFYEKGRTPEDVVHALVAMGHSVKEREPIGDVNALMIGDGKIYAVADPRHGGAAGGF